MNRFGKYFVGLGRIALGVFVTVVVYFIVALLMIALFGNKDAILENAVTITVASLAGLFATYRIRDIKEMFHKPDKPFLMLLITIGMSMGLAVLCNALFSYIPFDKLPGYITDYSEESYYVIPLWETFLLYCVVVPLAEEIIFRIIFYYGLKSSFPTWIAIVVSAAVFGLYHGNIQQGLYAFIMGSMMALMFYMTDNFAYTYIYHITANFLINLCYYNTGLSKICYSLIGIILAGIVTAASIIGAVILLKKRKAANN